MRKPFALDGVKLLLNPVISINFSSTESTSKGVRSFRPFIRKASNPLVIRASEYPFHWIFPFKRIPRTYTSELQPFTLVVAR